MGRAYLASGTNFSMHGAEYQLTKMVTEGTWQVTAVRTGRCIEMSMSDFLRRYCDREITLRGYGGQALRAYPEHRQDEILNQLSPSYRKHVLERLHYVRAVRGAQLPARTEATMTPVITKAFEALTAHTITKPPHWSTVLRWLIRYEEAGQDIGALIPRHRRKGRKRREVPSVLEPVIHDVIQSYYLTLERPSRLKTLSRINQRITVENRTRPLGARLPLAERWMLNRVIHDATSAYSRCAARHGEQAARVKFRGVLHLYTADRPLQRIQMDHAQLDIWVLDDLTGLPRGRPWLTAIIDVATRYVLGIYISFSPPGHMSVARCLRHAVLPKSDLKKRFPACRNDWEGFGIGETLVVDNGAEFHGFSLESMAGFLGIDLEFMPRKTPWFKGRIERWFGTLGRGLLEGTPGYTSQDVTTRGDYDPQQRAAVCMATLRELITRWVVDVYHDEYHSEIQTTPRQAWRDREHTIDRALPPSAADLDAHVGKTENRRLDHRGVTLNRLWYNSGELIAMRKRLGAVLSVATIHDTDDLGSIFVFDPETEQPVEVPALRHDYAAGLSLWQHKWIVDEATARGKDVEDIDQLLEVKAELTALVEADVQKKRGRRGRGARATRKVDLLPADATSAEVTVKSVPGSSPKPQTKTPSKPRTKGSAPHSGTARSPRKRQSFSEAPMPGSRRSNAPGSTRS